jgi:hypothetical protein
MIALARRGDDAAGSPPSSAALAGASSRESFDFFERVVVEHGEILEISARLEARPFFDGLPSRMAMAPPDGLEPPIAELLAYA